MDFSDSRYQKLKDLIHEKIGEGYPWDKIESFDIVSEGYAIPAKYYWSVQLEQAKIPEEEFSKEDWKNLVKSEKEKSKIKHLGKLAKKTRNNAIASVERSSQWYGYREHLRAEGFSSESIEGIQSSCQEILQQLDDNTINSSPVKGLVVGEVQSGKTANMAGLISMAADYGFNYFIIFSGIIENLRKQTEDRMFNDLKKPAKKFQWHRIENPSIQKALNTNELRWENIHLDKNERYFTVCLKNKSRMEDLLKWLYQDKNKVKKLKVLIIDDEADQASINTNEETKWRTSINDAMLNIVDGVESNKLLASNYISYTATPYANILSTGEKDTLYPSDFIFQLNSPADYIGAKKLFGLEDPQRDVDINYVRDIPTGEIAMISKIHKEAMLDIPDSLKRSIDWFFVSSAALRAMNYRKPVSMLIHTSHLKQHHMNINNAIQSYIKSMKNDIPAYLKKLKILYSDERAELPYQSFIDGMPGYSSKTINNYPEWSEVKPQIEIVLHGEELSKYTKLDEDNVPLYDFRGFQIAIDNSDSSIPKSDDEVVRLAYPEEKAKLSFAPMFIVIGGNTLSRGLTLKGLTTTYFCRQTNLGDSLMQMARWFGYRKGYELFPRVWLNSLTIERFGFLTQLNEELFQEIKDMDERGHTPSSWAPRLKNTPSLQFLQLTSSNKRRGAQEIELDFTGENWQTTIFDKDIETQKRNMNLTKNFLNSLESMDDTFIDNSRMIWRDVDFELVQDYLSAFSFNDRTKFAHVSSLLEWYQEVIQESGYQNWTVMVSSKGSITKSTDENEDCLVHGYNVPSVTRSYRSEDELSYNIGVLRTPTDQLYDIKGITKQEIANFKGTDIKKIRKKYNFDRVPQLVIYKIDGNNSLQDKRGMRIGTDIIGIFLSLPGIRKTSQIARYVNVRLPQDDEMKDMIEE
ncbi:Z1 domain-containing protein [Enterococcus sp. N342-3-1-2]